MYPYFDIEGISLDKLLNNWKWLIPEEFRLIAVSPFGDLFLENIQGQVQQLDLVGGTVSMIAESPWEFHKQSSRLRKFRMAPQSGSGSSLFRTSPTPE